MHQQISCQTITVKEITITDAVTTFLERVLMTSSPQTLTWYQRRLALFQATYGAKKLSEFEKSDLWEWYKNLQERVRRGTEPVPGKISIYTQHGYIRAVRRFFKWLYEYQILPENLAQDLKLPKLPRSGEKGVKDSDAKAILKAAKANERDYALITFMESTGCRRGGIADLRLGDLNLDAPEPICRRATVREKGGEEREVPMSPRALEAMRAWLEIRQSSTDFVFVDTHPNRKDHFGLSPDGISSILKRYKVALGIKGRTSPHQWRHRLGRKLTRSGMPLNLASQLLGHKTVLVTTRYYGTFAIDTLQGAMDHYYQDPEQ